MEYFEEREVIKKVNIRGGIYRKDILKMFRLPKGTKLLIQHCSADPSSDVLGDGDGSYIKFESQEQEIKKSPIKCSR